MEPIKSESTNGEWNLSANHWKSKVIWILLFSFYNASAGYRIGDGWKIYTYCLSNPNFYIDFLWSIFFLYFMSEWIKLATAYFDQKQLWRDEFMKRLFIQIIFIYLPTILYFEFVDRLYAQITHRTLFRIPQNILQLPFTMGISLIYTLFYSLTSLYKEYVSGIENKVVPIAEEHQEKTSDVKLGDLQENPVITIREGKDIRLLDLDIVLICNSNGMNTIYERDPSIPPIQDNHPLKYLVERLDTKNYYQITRWELVHRSVVKGYEVNGDKNFRLELDFPLDQQLVINKDKIDDFAKWLLGS
ncbi:hypothetical protein [Sphingobacterium thalpophilum]|uniref:hypothetical protein n=1 Tax=Sphingobacterium thalpophilum TaxID=259 RepID=UPI0024A6CFE0|nr:hypothetical protein [Sphingobacterium thalpophilum]